MHAKATSPSCRPDFRTRSQPHRNSDADLLIVITPGIERFEYFRHLARIATGQQPPESLLEVQARYDTFFDDSPAWQRAHRTTPPGS